MARKPERRKSERQALKIPVDYSAVDAFFSDFTHNINEGGMFVETESPQDLEASVQLHFKVPGLKEPLEVEGRVAWISDGSGDTPAGMGIEFQKLDEDKRATINDLVRRLRSNR